MCAQGASTGDVVALAAQLATRARAAHKAANDELAEVVNNVANYYDRVESRISQGALRGSSSAPDATLGSGCGGSGGKRRRAPKTSPLTEAALEQARATKAARLDPNTPANASNPSMAPPAVCTSAAASPTAVAATPDAAAPREVGFGDTVGLEYPDNSHDDGLDGDFFVGPNNTDDLDDSSIAPIVTTTLVRLVLAAPDATTPIVATGGIAADGAGAPSAEATHLAPAAVAAVVAAAPIVAPAAAAADVAAAPIVATTPATAEGELAALIAAALKK
jgi:hypothetical protein